tara:strand:- start:2408 stop:2830 length:423 start_codon:yes stop_codon:yes gene_type:complete
MNFVEVNGGNKVQREICHKVVAHMIKKLLPRFRTLDITVNLVTIKSEAIGFCMEQDKNQFEIELDKKISIKDMVTALCHEMVHVKQFARKEMVDGIKTGVARWKTKTIPLTTNYWDLPWEKEAYRMEKKLADDVWENGVI